VHWDALVVGALVPKLQLDRNLVLTVAAVLGTTISPYLFFWQASQEAEEQIARDRKPPYSLQACSITCDAST
jgi:Mn2+/Fe2+ NRAMP family transporter